LYDHSKIDTQELVWGERGMRGGEDLRNEKEVKAQLEKQKKIMSIYNI